VDELWAWRGDASGPAGCLVERSSTSFFVLDVGTRPPSSPRRPSAVSIYLALLSREAYKTGGSLGKVHFLHVASLSDHLA